jgi:Domain of unknown function (DUF4270)
MSVKYLGIPALVISALIIFACTKRTPFGSELLQDQSAVLTASDTLTLRTTVEPEENATTSDRQSTTAYLYCGQLNDPSTGRTTAELFTLFRPLFPSSGFVSSNFQNATIDSVVMALRYAGAGFYGDSTQAQTIRVFRTDQPIRNYLAYRANSSLPSGGELGSVTVRPRSSTALTHPFDTALTVAKAPHVRIRLNTALGTAFGRELLSYDSITYVDTMFRTMVRGLRITSTAATQPGAMMAFDMSELNNVSAINVYYTRRDGAKLRQTFVFRGNNKFNRFVHDYSGSQVSPVLNRPNPTRLYAKGLSGLRIKVEVPHIKKLGNVAINKAELILTVASSSTDPLVPAPQLGASYVRLTDTASVFIDDLLYSLGSTGTGGFQQFGGFPLTETVNGVTVQRYRINVTQHLQYILQGRRNTPNEFFINVIGNGSVFTSPARTVFHGPLSTTFPPRLSLKYTQIK